MSHPAFLEVQGEGEEPRFFRYDPHDRAHRAEARRQARSRLDAWLADYRHLLMEGDASLVEGIGERLAKVERIRRM